MSIPHMRGSPSFYDYMTFYPITANFLIYLEYFPHILTVYQISNFVTDLSILDEHFTHSVSSMRPMQSFLGHLNIAFKLIIENA